MCVHTYIIIVCTQVELCTLFKTEINDMPNMKRLYMILQKIKIVMLRTFYAKRKGQEETMVPVFQRQIMPVS